MNTIDISVYKFAEDRATLRKEIIGFFLDEEPGTGKHHLTSRYKYVTKVLQDGRQVHLSRPANFNNGFDFTLNVSGTNFNHHISEKRASTRPTHGNIYDDLILKRTENSKLYDELREQIDLVYNCKNPTKVNFNFNDGHPTELILECVKWLFVEQDVTYWNYSGRNMLYEGICEI